MKNEIDDTVKYATWSSLENPVYHVTCPHCGNLILMAKPGTIELLKRWGKKLFGGKGQ